MAGARDPFQPSDHQEEPLELAVTPPAARPAAPVLEPPKPRAKVVYKKPVTGAANLVLWTFATLGFVGVASAGIWWWHGHPADPAANMAAAKPVVWHSVARGDEVLVTVEVLPKAASGARLTVDGDAAISNPMLLPRGRHRIAAVADGFAPVTVEVSADAPKTVRLRLERAR
jgi:hypothetical protein